MAKFAKIAVLLFIAILSTTAYANMVVRQEAPSGYPIPSAPTPSGGDESPSPAVSSTPDAGAATSSPTPTPTPDVPVGGPVPSGIPSGAIPSGSALPGFSSLVGKYSTGAPTAAPSYVGPSTYPKSAATPATTPASAAHKVEASLISGIIIVGFASLFF